MYISKTSLDFPAITSASLFSPLLLVSPSGSEINIRSEAYLSYPSLIRAIELLKINKIKPLTPTNSNCLIIICLQLLEKVLRHAENFHQAAQINPLPIKKINGYYFAHFCRKIRLNFQVL